MILALCTIAFNALFYLWIASSDWFERYLALNAEASAVALRIFGDEATAAGTSLSSQKFSLDIKRGCDAVQVSAFFIFIVLASPVSVSPWRRALALAVGTALLLAINLVRIVSLYYTGVYFPSAFQAMHLDVWQPVFIFLALFFWVFWVWRVTRAETGKADATV